MGLMAWAIAPSLDRAGPFDSMLLSDHPAPRLSLAVGSAAYSFEPPAPDPPTRLPPVSWWPPVPIHPACRALRQQPPAPHQRESFSARAEIPPSALQPCDRRYSHAWLTACCPPPGRQG